MNSWQKSDPDSRLVLSAASASFGPSLLALLGTLNLNWPAHPPVRVYDLGMQSEILDTLQANQIEVVKVPPFCAHWRKHFTWKIWCLNDAPARHVLWMDAGLAVLQPLDEIFVSLDRLGYFVAPNNQLLDWEASEAACLGCGVAPAFRLGKPTLAGTMMGFQKYGAVGLVLQEALAVALNEAAIQATHPRHRHEQAILSLLLYKHFGSLLVADRQIYLGDWSPDQVAGQKIWLHRRRMLAQDLEFYRQHISLVGPPRLPLDPRKNRPKNPFVLGLRFLRSRYRRLRQKLAPPIVYDGIRDE